MELKLSVILPYTYGGKLRDELLGNVITSISHQTFRPYELIVVEEVFESELLGEVPGVFPYKDRAHNYILLKDYRLFNKGWCINVAVRQAKTDNILVVDADTIFGKEYFSKIMDFRKTHPNNFSRYFSGYNYIICLPGRDNPMTRVIHHSAIKASGGVWFANRKFFLEELGGMNENYFGYGGEDNDLWLRANHLLKEIPAVNYTVVHQYHDWPVPPLGTRDIPNKDQYLRNVRLLRRIEKQIPQTIQKLRQSDLGKSDRPTVVNL